MASISEVTARVVGLGADLVSVPRLRGLLDRHGERFLARVFTDGEIRYARASARPAESFAARFAAKEACFKAVGQGWPEDGIRYQDVEVVRATAGPPTLVLSGRLAELARARGAVRSLLTLSHTGEMAMAVVLLEAGAGPDASSPQGRGLVRAPGGEPWIG